MKTFFEIRENMAMKMKLINKMKKASPAAKKALEEPSRVDKKKESVEEGIVKSYHMAASKPWSVNVKKAKGTAGEYSQIAKGKDFTVWTGYVGSQKRMPHYVIRDDKLIGSGWTMNSALKDAGLKDKDLTARSKFTRGSILNKGMKEAVQVDEVSSTTLQRYKYKTRKILDRSTDEKEVKKRGKGYAMASRKLTNRILPKKEDVTEEKHPALKRAGVSAFNKPKRTPNHPSSSHIVVTKVDGKPKTIRFGQQGAKTAGAPKEGESDRMKAKRKSFKARHAKNIAKGKSSAAYWADKVKW